MRQKDFQVSPKRYRKSSRCGPLEYILPFFIIYSRKVRIEYWGCKNSSIQNLVGSATNQCRLE